VNTVVAGVAKNDTIFGSANPIVGFLAGTARLIGNHVMAMFDKVVEILAAMGAKTKLAQPGLVPVSIVKLKRSRHGVACCGS